MVFVWFYQETPGPQPRKPCAVDRPHMTNLQVDWGGEAQSPGPDPQHIFDQKGLGMAWRTDGTTDTILKVLVGSRAHGLHSETSDYDYRGVFVQPTREILSLGSKVRTTSWIEDRDPKEGGKKEDDTAWEIGHFLDLAMHCNPTILEVFTAPVASSTPEGEALRELFRYVWEPKRVRDAFIGYGLNQRKKMLEEKDKRPWKYAVAYLRVLLQAETLLRIGHLLSNMRFHPEFQTLQLFRSGLATPGQIIDKCREWQQRVEDMAAVCKQEPDPKKINEFLLSVREAH